MAYRIGIGYDVHCLVSERKLILGGVEIPYIKGLLGHSDADCLIHALCDALLGAAGESDIGELFPNTDPKYLDASSVVLLGEVLSLIGKKGFSCVNIDAVVIAQEPPISPFKKQIRQNLSRVLSLPEECVNVKAKTAEGLGEIGRKEAIACYVVAMIEKN